MVKKGSAKGKEDGGGDHPMDLSTISEGKKKDAPVVVKEKATPKKKTKAVADEEDEGGEEKKPKAKKAQTMVERDPIGKYRTLPSNGKFTKIISWNVAGLRGILKKNADVLKNLVVAEQPDILCLQEHKLQPDHAQDFVHLLSDLGYKGLWTYSVEKKGYSGTVVFVRATLSADAAAAVCSPSLATSSSSPAKKSKKQASLDVFFGKTAGGSSSGSGGGSDTTAAAASDLSPPTMVVENVLYDLPDKRFGGEGRIIQIETPGFYFIGSYVPNSGQKLERLDYRTNEWDVYIRDYMRDLAKNKPVIFGGDLNVAHLDIDIYNAGQPHLKKQAGTTPEERESFGVLLSSGFKDALRHFYPEARGQFTYWSQRTFARPVNNGLRLDYFVCSESLFSTSSSSSSLSSSSSASSVTGQKRSAATADAPPTVAVVDSYILHTETEGYSDHAPVVLILQET